jgi:hypothetical protein
MPLTLGQLQFNKLNGPVSFRCLKPTTKLSQTLGRHLPILMLLGDSHYSRKNLCEKESKEILSVFTALFLRILDSIGTKECPVEYYLEAFFPPELLQDPWYLSAERKHWVYEVDNKTVMTWIAKYHLECFSQLSGPLLQCPTTNVQYQFSDLRLGQTFAKLNSSDKYKSMNDAILTAETYMFAPLVEAASKASSKAHKTFSRNRKKYIYEHSIDKYESLLHDTIASCHSPYRSRSSDRIPVINGVPVFQIIDLLYSNPKQCANILFDLQSRAVRKHSMLYEAIRSSLSSDFSEEKWMEWCQQIFVKYFVYVCKQDQSLAEHEKIVKKSMKTYNQVSEMLRAYTLVTGKVLSISQNDKIVRKDPFEGLSEEIAHQFQKLASTIELYEKAFTSLATTMLIPFNDLFMMFSGWKPAVLSPLVVYHAGDFHCSCLTQFLIQEKLFEHATPQIELNSKTSRCLDMTNLDINVDQAVFKNLIASKQNQAYINLKNKRTIVYNRIQIFGEKLYKEILSGRLVTKQELTKLLQNFEVSEIKEATESLDIKTLSQEVFIPSEYTNKLRF